MIQFGTGEESLLKLYWWEMGDTSSVLLLSLSIFFLSSHCIVAMTLFTGPLLCPLFPLSSEYSPLVRLAGSKARVGVGYFI